MDADINCQILHIGKPMGFCKLPYSQLEGPHFHHLININIQTFLINIKFWNVYSILLLWIVNILFLWILTLEQHACLQPALVGECQNYTARWYYDSLESQCRQFYFGGCGGNNNNFLSQEDCQRICDHGYQPPPPPRPQQQLFVTEPPQLPEPRTPFSTGIFCVLLILWVICWQ